MRVGIYLRVSTEEQAREGYSVSGQLQKLKAFCISQNWEVSGVYSDEGISAKDLNRPDLQRLLADIEADKVDCVLVYRLDRLTRSVFDLYKLLERFEKHNCKFKSATEVYDTTTAMGRMFITIVAALAQWERENMGERIAFGFEEKVRQGKCPFNFSPFGYTLNKEESKLYINPVEAETVRELFNNYLEGLGSNRLSKYLNERGHRTKHGNKWNSMSLLRLLKSPIVAGGIVWNDNIYWDTHEAIISRVDWDKAQEILAKRRSLPAKSISSPHIFSRLIRCSGCGQMFTGNQTSYTTVKDGRKVYYFYRCAEARYGRCDNRRSISESKMEKAFVEFLQTWDISSELYKQTAEVGLSVKDEPVVNVEALELELDRIEKMKKKWQYAWAEELIDHNDFKSRMDEAVQKENVIKEQIAEVEPPTEVETVDVMEIESMLNDLKINWEKLKGLEKKNIINELLSEIHIEFEDKDVKISDVVYVN